MNIQLLQWRPEFLDSLVLYANNKKIADNLADAFPHPYTREDGMAFIDRASTERPTKIFAISYGADIIGSVGIFPDTDIHRKNAAIAYWIAEPFWGKGAGTEAIRQITAYGFSTFDIIRIYAKPFGYNIASHKALENAGFSLEARLENTIYKNGAFSDELIYRLMKNI